MHKRFKKISWNSFMKYNTIVAVMDLEMIYCIDKIYWTLFNFCDLEEIIFMYHPTYWYVSCIICIMYHPVYWCDYLFIKEIYMD